MLPRSQERLVVLAMGLAAFAMNLNANVDAALLPFWHAEYGWSRSDQGLLLAAAGYGGAVGALLLGPLVDRLGRRPPLLAGLVLFAAASALHATTTSFSSLLVLRALTGAAAGVAYSSASAAVADVVPYRRRAAAMGVFSAMMFLSVPVGLPVAVMVARSGNWQLLFAVQAGVGLLACAAAAVTVPKGLGKGGWVAPHKVLARGPVLACLVAVLLYVGAFSVAVRFSGAWLDDVGLVPKESQGSLWLVLGLSAALGSFFLGRLGDIFGKKKFVLLTSMTVTLLLVLLTKIETVPALLALGLPIAMITASRTGPLQALMSELVGPGERGTLMGLRAAFMQLGIALFAHFGGVIYEDHGYQRMLYLSAGGVAASWLLLRLFLKGVR